MPNYSPAFDDGLIVYMPGFDQYPQYYWKDAAKTDPATTAGDLIRAIDSGIILGPTWVNYGGEDDRRPTLGSDGGVQFAGTGTSEDGMQIASSTALLNTILSNGYAEIGWMFKCDSGFGFTSSAMIDNNNFSTTARGLHLGTVAVNTSHAALRVMWGNGSANLLTLQTEEEVDNNAWNRARLHVEPGTGNSWLQVGNGARVYGTLTGSLLTGNAASSLFIGRRGAAGTPFKGQLKNIRIGTTWGATALAAWESDSPTGSITGDPELSGANIHLNLNKTYYYCPRFIYFNGQQISDPTDSDGAVYAWDNSSGWQGSGHGAGAPPEGGETVISATVRVDGAQQTLTDGERYTGTTLTMQRVTSTVAFASQTHTVTISGNSKYDHIRMVRNGLAGSGNDPGIRSMYPIRNTRAPSFTAYMSLDDSGTEITSGTMGSGTVTLVGARGVAQFSSDLGVMALIVMTQGHRLPGFQHIILDVPQNKRIYQEIEDYQNNMEDTEGTVLEMASVTKFYETDADNWKALASSELLKVARQSIARVGFGRSTGLVPCPVLLWEHSDK